MLYINHISINLEKYREKENPTLTHNYFRDGHPTPASASGNVPLAIVMGSEVGKWPKLV